MNEFVNPSIPGIGAVTAHDYAIASAHSPVKDSPAANQKLIHPYRSISNIHKPRPSVFSNLLPN